jgi:hypothetical protein
VHFCRLWAVREHLIMALEEAKSSSISNGHLDLATGQPDHLEINPLLRLSSGP